MEAKISGEELYKILSCTIYEREGIEHEGYRIEERAAKEWIDEKAGEKEIEFDRRGIKIDGLIIGDPDKDGTALNCFGLKQNIPISIKNSLFLGDIIIENARLNSFSLSGSIFSKEGSRESPTGRILADATQFDGDLDLSEVACASIFLTAAQVANRISLEGARIDGAYNEELGYNSALCADGIIVGGSFWIRGGGYSQSSDKAIACKDWWQLRLKRWAFFSK